MKTTTVQRKCAEIPYVAQKFDTLGYLQSNFIDRKSAYLNKESNVLLKDLWIPCLSYVVHPSRTPGIVPGISLFFVSIDEENKVKIGKKRNASLIITWQSPVPFDSAVILIRSGKGKWLTPDRDYYGKQIVGDLSAK